MNLSMQTPVRCNHALTPSAYSQLRNAAAAFLIAHAGQMVPIYSC